MKIYLLAHLSFALAVAAASSPNPLGLHRRDHADLGRFMKKRTPLDILGSQPSTQTPSSAAQSIQGASTAAQTTPANSVSVQTTSLPTSASASASPSVTSGDASSALSSPLPTGSSTTTSSASSTPLSSASNYPSSTPETSVHTGDTPSTTVAQSILYLTSSTASTPTQTSSSSSSSGISHAAATVFIVIAVSIGAAVIVWTIIRKWKFRPSSDFEGRMQPIDWQPGTGDEDAGLPAKHHRPLSRASSFQSGSGNAHVDDQMRGTAGAYGTSMINPIPDHDFTAGPAHFAAVGGYADLARGPGPQAMMQESFGGAPSINRPVQYDSHGVPLYHGYNGY